MEVRLCICKGDKVGKCENGADESYTCFLNYKV